MTAPGQEPGDQPGVPAAEPLGSGPPYLLTLVVSGASGLAARAVEDVRRICDTYLAGRYDLAVIDIHDPTFAPDVPVVATPTLVRRWPLPVRKIIGDLSDDAKVLAALDLPASVAPTPERR